MELIDLQNNTELKEKYNLGLIIFYSKYLNKIDFLNFKDTCLENYESFQR